MRDDDTDPEPVPGRTGADPGGCVAARGAGDRTDELVGECLERARAGGDPAQGLERLCAQHPDLAGGLRERSEVLRRVGCVPRTAGATTPGDPGGPPSAGDAGRLPGGRDFPEQADELAPPRGRSELAGFLAELRGAGD